jgi:hypothetical protein
MPKLIATRFDLLKKTADDFSTTIDENGHTMGEKYDIGRIRLFLHTMGTSIRDRSNNINNIIKMNDAGIKEVDRMYEEYSKEYEDRTGKTLSISRDDFIDMVRNNLHNEVRELSVLLLLLAATLSTGFLAPGDHKDKGAKNSVNFMIKCLGKFQGQLAMFYDPAEWTRVLTGGIFPSLGIFTDIGRFIEHMTLMYTGMDITHPLKDRDEVLKKAHPLKYGLEVFPGSKQFIDWMAMFNTDFAKSWDVNISSQNLK